ncbi:MAG: ATPase domain-containing protein [Candidatus Heimdallarchaeota archaeon]
MSERTSTGIPNLDSLMKGGIPIGTITLAKGQYGTGKSTLGVQYLVEGARNGKKGILIVAEQDRNSVLKNFVNLGLQEAIEQDLILLVDFSRLRSLESDKKLTGKFALQIFDELDAEDAQLLVLDSLQSFALTVLGQTHERVRDLMFDLADRCRRMDVTALFISEEETQNIPGIEEYVMDNVIQFSNRRLGNWEHKTVQVAKMRGTNHDAGIHGIFFTNKGLDLVLSYAVEPTPSAIIDAAQFGIPALDNLLGGGIPRGSFFLLEVDSLATHWQKILGAWHARVKGTQEGTIAIPGSSMATKEAVDIFETSEDRQITFIDAYGRKKASNGNKSQDGWITFKRADSGQQIVEMINSAASEASKDGWKPFRIHMNMSDLAAFMGEENALAAIPKSIELLKNHNNVLVAVFTPELHASRFQDSLRYFASGILKIWVENGLEVLQVIKTQAGTVSRPFIVRRTSQDPFVTLL